MDSNKNRKKEAVDLYAFAAGLAAELSSAYKDTHNCRVRLLQMLDENNWFGQAYEFKGDAVFVCPNDTARSRLPLWLEAFGMAPVEKMCLLLDHFQDAWPHTCSAARTYLEGHALMDSPSALMAVDHLLFFVQAEETELGDMKEADIHRLYESSCMRLHRTSFQVLQDLAAAIVPDFAGRWEYEMNPYMITLEDETSAYSPDIYLKLGWFVLNEDSWKANRLLEKGKKNGPLAKKWLFIAMHFTCGLRATDLCLLRPPKAEKDLAVLAAGILKSPERDSEAAALAQEWERQLSLTPRPPHKTRRFQNIPDLVVHIPEELQAPIGVILATALLHYDGDTPLMAGPVGVRQLRDLFGQEAVDLLDGHGFSTRRANKSYLQGIAASAGGDRFLAYQLASMARSHKGGYAALAGTTDIYLRDASFAGHAPDHIAYQLFQRGPFSWVLVRLLEAMDKKRFHSLTVQGQTELLAKVSLSPYQAEAVWKACSEAGAAARGHVNALIRGRNAFRNCFLDALHEMGNGCAPEERCLSRVTGGCCQEGRRTACEFCPYDLLAPALVGEVMKEYVRLNVRVLSSGDGPEGKRLRSILATGWNPILEGLRCLARVDGKDAPAMKQLMKDAGLMVRKLNRDGEEQ